MFVLLDCVYWYRANCVSSIEPIRLPKKQVWISPFQKANEFNRWMWCLAKAYALGPTLGSMVK